MPSTNGSQASTQIEGLGLYQYDQADFDYLMQHGQRTRANLVTEVLERTGDDHKNDGYRTLVRRLRKEQLAAMVAEWETGARENEEWAAQQRPAAVVTNVSGLSPTMRAGLVDRYRVPAETARALFRRGLVTTGRKWAVGGFEVKLTEGGERARDAVLAPFTPGTRVRNIRTALVGRVVRLERGERSDVAVLRWDTWRTDTAGSPAYLEVIEDSAPETGTVVDVLPDGSTVVRPIEDPASEGTCGHSAVDTQVARDAVLECGCPVAIVVDEGHQEGCEQVQATMPTTTDYNGVKPSAQAPGYAYGFLRAAVLGQAAGRPFSDPVAAVRHLDECLRLAGYSVSTMEG